MSKLLSANFARLWKNKVFWLSMATMFVYSVVYMMNASRRGALASSSGYHHTLDQYYFIYGISIGIFCAVFISLFLGTEYSDGTIRNKLIVGHTRSGIYFSNLIVCFSASMLIMAVWLITALIGIPTLGIWEMGILGLMVYVLISIMFVAAFSAIFTFLGMILSGKAVTAVVSILLFLGLLLFGSMIYNSVTQPEMISNVIIAVDDMPEMTDPMPNPDYITGTKRTIYEFIMDFLPTSQGILMMGLQVSNPLRMIVSSIFITVVITAVGIILFRKKDLK